MALEAFGGRSICSLKIHVANTYKYWLGHFTGIEMSDLTKSESCSNVEEVRALFTETNVLVKAFLDEVDGNFNEAIHRKVPLRDFELALTPLQLFTQVITHEFHHKGQILSMSRQLGYKPIDTDIIRFD